MIAAIVAMTEDRVIGVGGRLPWHYSEDLKRFRRLTSGHTVVMGRKTWESLPRRPLPERVNVVISRHTVDGAICYPSLDTALAAGEGLVWIIGGAQLFAAALAYCAMIDVTLVPDRIHAAGAVYFPDIDPAAWLPGATRVNPADSRLRHCTYTRRNPIPATPS